MVWCQNMKNKKKRALIITGGSLEKEFLEHHLEKNAYTMIICVDSGLKVADQMQLNIDYIVGDFDSIEDTIINKYKKAIKEHKINTTLMEYNPIKDATDTQIAVELAIEKEVDTIVILGGMGTRMDHFIATIHILLKAVSKNIETYLLDAHNKIYLANQSFSIEKRNLYGPYLSLLPFTEKVEGITLKGMKYPLSDYTMTIGESLGVSNEVIQEKAEVAFRTGILIVVEASDH